ncbi:MAG: hypothetical protein JWQ33_1822 [Ramlibacter sp.]|nr:hypothetical protein [Ramlibacter sp.]
MNENKTPSILHRLPVILAVTAASYGLPLHSELLRDANIHRASSAHGAATSMQPAPVRR